ncbi:MAG: N-6 DNA methylase [Prochlorothrix sp.]
MSQLEHIGEIEKRLWEAADTLRANSGCASNEYFLPVMGLLFLRHAYSRFLRVKREVEPTLPNRGGKTRALTKVDFAAKGAIFLQPESQYDYLVGLPAEQDRAEAIAKAMTLIEEDYEPLRGQLPKQEYADIESDVLKQLLDKLDPEALKKVDGDIFGRIYEYFLTKFADQDAHDRGEFFTPISLVSLIANVLEPTRGVVLDPACGSGGMFVQSARLVDNPQELTFVGLEKNATTIRLAKMNLAVHGLEGSIQEENTYYTNKTDLIGQASYVMANPPFNMYEVDSTKVESDARLPFGLPGVNKNKKVSNGNYLWISYFYTYLNEQGRAGFVMSSQASSAGRDEGKVRQKLIETGDVDIMIAIRNNFFYTRSVPCELWFFDRAKPEAMRDKVLMIDARQIYRQVTRKIFDFSPEQQSNILSIVWLYRGQSDRFLELAFSYADRMLREGVDGEALLKEYEEAIATVREQVEPFLQQQHPQDELWLEFQEATKTQKQDGASFSDKITQTQPPAKTAAALGAFVEMMQPIAEQSRDLVKQVDLVYKLAGRLVERCEGELKAKDYEEKTLKAKNGKNGTVSALWNSRAVKAALKALDESRQGAVNQLKQVRYFFRQVQWLMVRFPDGELRDVEGLVKLVDRAELKANDWSLTPGRYVGVAPEAVDEDFDFEEALREIHVELQDLNAEAVELAAQIAKNFEELGV